VSDKEKPHPFGDMQKGRDKKAEWNLSEARRFEEGKVQFLLKRFGVTNKKWDMLRKSRDLVGENLLTVSLFNEMFPTFPIVLGCSRLGGVKLHTDLRCTTPALFRRFQDAPWVEAYEEFYEQVSGQALDRTIGLIFPRKGVQQGLLIHNGGLDAYWVRGLRWTYFGGTKEKPQLLYVQPFAPLVGAIHNNGHGWRPTQDMA